MNLARRETLKYSAAKKAKELAEAETSELDQLTQTQQDPESQLLKSALLSVKKKAKVNEVTRLSPGKIYRDVKSKVARNNRVVNKTNARKAFGGGPTQAEIAASLLEPVLKSKLLDSVRASGAMGNSKTPIKATRSVLEVSGVVASKSPNIATRINEEAARQANKRIEAERIKPPSRPASSTTPAPAKKLPASQTNASRQPDLPKTRTKPKSAAMNRRPRQERSNVDSSTFLQQASQSTLQKSQMKRPSQPSTFSNAKPQRAKSMMRSTTIKQLVKKGVRQLLEVDTSKVDFDYTKTQAAQAQERKAIARELYIDSTVNVVDPIGTRTSKAKVVPGRLNLFNPKGQKSLQIPVGSPTKQLNSPLSGGHWENANATPNIFHDEQGEYFRIKNETLAERNIEVEKEFERIMAERANLKTFDIALGKQQLVETSVEEFYANEGLGSQNKHKSPTRRLIQHKDSAWEHKLRIQSGIHKGDYSQTYCPSPGKSFVIEPQGGELPYELAEKKPQQFYNVVLTQDIKKYRVKKHRRQQYEIVHRQVQRVLTSIKEKIIQKIGEEIGFQYSDDIKNALATEDIEQKIIDLAHNEEVELIDVNNQVPILKTQMSLVTDQKKEEKGKDGLLEESIDGPPEPMEASFNPANQPDIPQVADDQALAQAQLQMSEPQYSDLRDQVVEIVKRQSVVEGAQLLQTATFARQTEDLLEETEPAKENDGDAEDGQGQTEAQAADDGNEEQIQQEESPQPPVNAKPTTLAQPPNQAQPPSMAQAPKQAQAPQQQDVQQEPIDNNQDQQIEETKAEDQPDETEIEFKVKEVVDKLTGTIQNSFVINNQKKDPGDKQLEMHIEAAREHLAKCEADLAKGQPDMAQISNSLNALDLGSIQELRALGSPPEQVKQVCFAVQILKDGVLKNHSWKEVKKMLVLSKKFLQEIRAFDGANIDAKRLKAVKPFLSKEWFNPESLSKVSIVAACFCSWVLGIVEYNAAMKKMRVLREAVEKAKAEYQALQQSGSK